MNEVETDMDLVPGSRCSRCGEFVSDLDAGFSLAAHGYMHTECGGTWLLDMGRQYAPTIQEG